MLSTSERLSILIVGATSKLGLLLTKAILDNPKLIASILVRDPTKNPDLVTQVESKGGKVFNGDLNIPETLDEATKGIHTVLSIANIHDQKGLDGQISLIDASVKNGVKRFVPAEYGVLRKKFSKDLLRKLPPLEYKEKVEEYLNTQPIAHLHIYNGAFEYIFQPLFGDFVYYGDSNQNISLIALNDLAQLSAAAISQKDSAGDVFFSGNVLTLTEAAKAYSKVKGKDVEATRGGSVEDLEAQFEERIKGGFSIGAFLIALKWFTYNGSQPEKGDNDKFLKLEITPIEEVFRKLK